MPRIEIDRSPLAFFNTAQSYQRSAEHLSKLAPKEVTHPHLPVEFLFCHALELYLKAYLRATGCSVETLRLGMGHSFSKLLSAAEEQGLEVAPADKATFQELEDWDVAMEARYIVTGPGHEFTPEMFVALCSNLEHLVGSALTRMGMHVRPLRML